VGTDTFAFGLGRDILDSTGNPFSSPSGAIGVDTITNFTVGTDKIQLSKSYFSLFASPTGNTLSASNFSTVTTDAAAAMSSSGIVYNGSNGKLFYNVDGSAIGFGASGGQFAQLTAGLSLTAADFITNTI
jgi:hypothetical protein